MILALILLAGAAMSAPPPFGVTFSGELPANSWIAIRFNVTPDNDLSVPGQLRIFPGDEVRIGGAAFKIVDGEAAFKHLYTGSMHWWVNRSSGHVQTPIARIEPEAEPLGDFFNGQQGWGSLALGAPSPFPHPNRSFTLLAIYRAAHADFKLDATWTRGVQSWDVQTGPATVLAPDELGAGVHVGSYTWAAQAGAGVLLERETTTTRDTVGWFVPHNEATAGYAQARCTENGAECEPFGGWLGAQKVISKGPTEWSFAIDAVVSECSCGAALGIAELPDDTYLSDGPS